MRAARPKVSSFVLLSAMLIILLSVLSAITAPGCNGQRVELDGTPMNPTKASLVDLNVWFAEAENAISSARDAKIIQQADIDANAIYFKTARESLDKAGEQVRKENYSAADAMQAAAKVTLDKLAPLAIKAGYKNKVGSR